MKLTQNNEQKTMEHVFSAKYLSQTDTIILIAFALSRRMLFAIHNNIIYLMNIIKTNYKSDARLNK